MPHGEEPGWHQAVPSRCRGLYPLHPRFLLAGDAGAPGIPRGRRVRAEQSEDGAGCSKHGSRSHIPADTGTGDEGCL